MAYPWRSRCLNWLRDRMKERKLKLHHHLSSMYFMQIISCDGNIWSWWKKMHLISFPLLNSSSSNCLLQKVRSAVWGFEDNVGSMVYALSGSSHTGGYTPLTVVYECTQGEVTFFWWRIWQWLKFMILFVVDIPQPHIEALEWKENNRIKEIMGLAIVKIMIKWLQIFTNSLFTI